MGTPDFAVAPLKAILDSGFEVCAIITAPDKPAGRGRALRQSPVKEFALEHKLHVLQPVSLKDPSFIEELRSFKANLQVVVAFRMLPRDVWQMPALGTFNLHASLLPQYRGAAPINWALINGEKETGITTFFLDHEIDTGKIILFQKLPIREDDTAGTLHDRMSLAGAQLVVDTLNTISTGQVPLREQGDMITEIVELKPAPKIFKEDCQLDWNQTAFQLHNRIRGLSPVPGAYTSLLSPDGKVYSLKIFKSVLKPDILDCSAGTLITDRKNLLEVKTADVSLQIIDLQLEGKKRMTTPEFLRGFPIDGNWKMQ